MQTEGAGVIGRLYTWRGAVWLLLVRWAGPPHTAAEWRCDACGRIRGAHPGRGAVPHLCFGGELRQMRRVGGPVRNVLLERLDYAGVEELGIVPWIRTGDRVVRPFRGLRRWKP